MSESSPNALAPLKALIVEDSARDAELLTFELTRIGFELTAQRVDTQAGFEAGLKEGVDIIFSDFALPNFSVERGLQLLHESDLDIPFIIISGSIGEELAVQTLKAGATDYLLKDSLGRLGPAVRRALRESKERARRKSAEQAQRESEHRLRQLAENVQEVFWMTDVEKRQLLYISPAYERIWGRSLESLYENPREWVEAIFPEDRGRVLDAATAKQVTGDYDEIYRIQRPDGSVRWIHDRAYPIRDSAGNVFRVAGTAEDITEQHHLEAQLRQAQKLEAIGTLAGGIAHDFNNILGAIIGYSDLARSEIEGVPHVVEYLKEVSKAALRAKDLIRQILTFSRQQEHERAPVQIRHVVGEALKLLRAGTPSTIQFETALSRDTPAVLADATQIHQIVMNLGTNAAHAMRDKAGVLETTLEPFTITEEIARLRPNLKPGDFARLTMRDTGHGMDRVTLQRIFEPFFTTKPPGEGTGLGLSVVHGIMLAHGGCLDVQSAPGKGAVFELYFPAIPHVPVEAERTVHEIPKGKGERILAVDDEEPLLRVMEKILGRMGYVVEAANSPIEAIKLFQANPAAFSVVITDLTMPGMTGIDLASALWKTRPEMPIILMTGYSGAITPAGAQALGIRELLFKPVTVDATAQAVQRALKPIRHQNAENTRS